MDSALIALPIILTIVVGFASQLEDLAMDSSQKALDFADDMNKAMECASKGIPITLCSPNVTSYDFSAETGEFDAILEDMQEELSLAMNDLEEELALLNATNTTYDSATNTTTIIYVIEGGI